MAWMIHRIANSDMDGEPPIFAVLPDDDTNGLVVGEAEEVKALADRLAAWLANHADDGEISDVDERLGLKWLTTAQAAREFSIGQSSINLACRQGRIREAKLEGKTWRFPQCTFLAWLNARPGRGNRTTQSS